MSEKETYHNTQKDTGALRDAYRDLFSIFDSNVRHSSSEPDHNRVIDSIMEWLEVDVRPVPDEIVDPYDRLEYLLAPTGVMYREVKLDGPWWKETVGPLLATHKDGRVIALLPAFPSGYAYRDGTTGHAVRVNKKTAADIEQTALCFYRSLPPRKLTFKDLVTFFLKSISTGDILWIVAASLFAALLGMLTPYLNKLIFDSIIPSGIMGNIAPITGMLVGAAVGGMLFEISRQLVLRRFRDKITFATESAMMSRVFSLPASFFKNNPVGEITQRINSVSDLAIMLTDTLFTSGLTALFSFVYIFQMMNFAPSLVAPALLVILVTLAFICFSALFQSRQFKRQTELHTELNGMVIGVYGGIQKIKLAGAEDRAFANWARLYTQSAQCTYDPPLFIKANQALSQAITLGGTILLYFVAGTTLVSQSDYMAFSAAYGAVSGAILALGGLATQLSNVKPLLSVINPLMDVQPEIAENKKQVTSLEGAIELSSLSFRYAEDLPWIIDNLNLKIEPGEYLGIVGKSGCGKSTLMRLLIGFETPENGSIYYDEQDLSDLDVRSLRQQVGVALQNGKLFSGDILSNITVTAPWSTLEDAWEAARLAGMEEEIQRMPMGMHTLVSENGGGLSGGQKQRLLIARALISKPKVLLFDEATSALDNVVQKKIGESIDNLGCTRLVIAHRLSTVQRCDRIIFLDKGVIVEEGTYEELMALKGMFYEFAIRQI